MPIIDVHAHMTPERFKEAIASKGVWHGLGPETHQGSLPGGGFAVSLSERLAEMDRIGIDMQLVSPTQVFYQYDNDLADTIAIARDCNDELAEIADAHSDRFAGLATLPMQDTPSAIAEMERAIQELNLHGVVVSDHVCGRTYDEPEFRPFFAAAERLGAIVFFHQGGDTCVAPRIKRYALQNAVGNLTERTLVFSALVFGGVMDDFPKLKPLLAHAGGYTVFGIGRLDKVAGSKEGGYPETGLEPPFGAPEDWHKLERPPSTYLSEFYYDCCTYDDAALRFLIDAVGVDRVMLGTDYPAPMLLKDSVEWVRNLPSLSEEEKEAVLVTSATRLLMH